jgi:ribosomal protein S18 acetylase RimI-like enzyme
MGGVIDLKLRSMSPDDYTDVTALWRGVEGLGPPEPREGFARFLARNPGLSAVALDGALDDRLIGAAWCGHDGRRGYIYHLAVVPTHRRRGVGTALAARCMAGLAAEKIERCTLFAYGGNRDGLAFWRRSGWLYRNELVVMQHAVG